MLPRRLACHLPLVLLLATLIPRAHSQTGAQPDTHSDTQLGAPYHLNVSVDEVVLTFHAADANGLSVNDLQLSDLTLLDNNKPPAKILNFQLQQNFPIRADLLIDTSGSMSPQLHRDQSIALAFAQQILRQPSDQIAVTTFDRALHTIQPWTSNLSAVNSAIRTPSPRDPLGGTALFDALDAICRNTFGAIDHRASGNMILLFSDGSDNKSTIAPETAIDACQRTNTAIYVFSSDPHDGSLHPGTRHLAQLARQTGGAIFYGDVSTADIFADLRTMEANLRNQYRLVFRPASAAHDGAFHPIVLVTPDRVATLTIRSGYYDRKPQRSAATPAPPSPDR